MKHLVRFFLSLSYADEHLLGWDPTMRIFRAPVTNQIQYIITMRTPTANDPTRFRSEYYLTKEIISDFGPTCLRGRGTRVWKVVRCTKAGQLFGPNSEVKILKDCWVDDDSDREGDIVSCVLSDAKKLGKYDEMKASRLPAYSCSLPSLPGAYHCHPWLNRRCDTIRVRASVLPTGHPRDNERSRLQRPC